MMNATYEVVGDLRGAFWWPYGEEWEKPLTYSFERGSVDSFPSSAPVHSTLREALDRATNDGDSSSGCHVFDGALKVTVYKSNGYRVRYFPLDMFPSIQDYLMA